MPQLSREILMLTEKAVPKNIDDYGTAIRINILFNK